MVTLCSIEDAQLKAGLNNSSVMSGAFATKLIQEAEGFICASARYDFIGLSGSTSAVGKEFLRDVCSSLTAVKLINYDMSGFTSRTEAQTMLDINYSTVVEGINLLRDDKFRDFVIKGEVA